MGNDLSLRLEKYRLFYGLTEEELASKLDAKASLIEDFEKGKSNPNGDMLYKIAQLYDISLDQLLNLDPDEIIRDDGSPAEPLPLPKNAEKKEVAFTKRSKKIRLVRYIFFTFVSALVYAALGITLGLWHPLWIIFIAVPLEVSLFDVVEYRNVRKLNFPFLVVLVYVLFGCLFGWWHPSWLVFITIPLFYVIF